MYLRVVVVLDWLQLAVPSPHARLALHWVSDPQISSAGYLVPGTWCGAWYLVHGTRSGCQVTASDLVVAAPSPPFTWLNLWSCLRLLNFKLNTFRALGQTCNSTLRTCHCHLALATWRQPGVASRCTDKILWLLTGSQTGHWTLN